MLRFQWILLFCCASLMAQNPGDFNEMLSDATAVLFSQPQQTIKITEHVVQNSDNSAEIIKAYLLQGRAFYVGGELDQAVKATLEAKKLAEASENIEMQLEINAFGIHLLNLFGLDLAAEKYYEFTEAILSKDDNEKYKPYLEGGKALLRAYDNIEQEVYKDALSNLSMAKSNFEKIPDPLLVDQIQQLQSEIYIHSEPLDSAQIKLERLLVVGATDTPNEFLNMIALNQLGEVYFLKKAYPRAIDTLKAALTISERLGNKIYRLQILERLAINYLALEDSEHFYSYKNTAAVLSNEVEADEDQAVNTVFNYTNANHAGKRDLVKNTYERNILILSGLLFLVLTLWWALRIRYRSRTEQYRNFLKYFERREQLAQRQTQPKKDAAKSSLIPKDTENILIKKLDQFENSTQFTKQDMSLASLAAQFDTNTKYLSEVINTHKDKNFNSYINELRINYIIDKLKSNSTYLQYKISYLAEESGFSSHSSFATVFKSVTGISPTVFIDLLNSQRKASKTVKEYDYAE